MLLSHLGGEGGLMRSAQGKEEARRGRVNEPADDAAGGGRQGREDEEGAKGGGGTRRRGQ